MRAPFHQQRVQKESTGLDGKIGVKVCGENTSIQSTRRRMSNPTAPEGIPECRVPKELPPAFHRDGFHYAGQKMWPRIKTRGRRLIRTSPGKGSDRSPFLQDAAKERMEKRIELVASVYREKRKNGPA
jgi:hypothetical protein